jgi:molecular chaperone HtpG
VLHFAVEGKSEFKALLFIPAHKPFSFGWEEPTGGLKLYVQRVLIMDRCEQVLPPYLRFVKGVIDSADLPLNVSRELLQQNPHLDTIQKNVVRNVLSGLEGMKNTEFEKYLRFYRDLGPVLKEGLSRDWQNKDKIADLLLFASANTEPGKFTTLAEYVEKMTSGQTHVHFLTGESEDQLRHSPYLEAFRAKGQDVLLLTDPIDEFAIPAYGEYKGKPFQAADRGELKGTTDEVPADVAERFAGLLTVLKEKLPEVADVRLTRRLTESAACLVAEAGGMTAHMERLMRQFGEAAGQAKRVLEVNPENAAVVALRELHERNSSDPRIESYARLLYEQAVIAEGSKIVDSAGFARRVNELIAATVRA